VDTLGIVAMGIGAYMMYEAVRNKQPEPLKKARDTLKTITPGQQIGPNPNLNTTLPPPGRVV
jgi:hypothetical protein